MAIALGAAIFGTRHERVPEMYITRRSSSVISHLIMFNIEAGNIVDFALSLVHRPTFNLPNHIE
jgi:hypothetical protein